MRQSATINQNTKQYYHDCTVNKKSHLHLYNVHCMMIDAIKHGKYCPKFKSLCGVCKIEICELFLYFGQILVTFPRTILQCSTLAKRLGEVTTEAFDWVHQKGVTMVGGRHARTHNNATLIFGRVCCRAYLCTLLRIFVYVRCKSGVNNVR